VAEPVRVEHLVVGEGERVAHPVGAGLLGVHLVGIATAELAHRQVRDEWLPPAGLPAARRTQDASLRCRVPGRSVPRVSPPIASGAVPPPAARIALLLGTVPASL
jgi:hypothetical protein